MATIPQQQAVLSREDTQKAMLMNFLQNSDKYSSVTIIATPKEDGNGRVEMGSTAPTVGDAIAGLEMAKLMIFMAKFGGAGLETGVVNPLEDAAGMKPS